MSSSAFADPSPEPRGSAAGEHTSAIASREQMRWFTTLWVMAAVFHYTDGHPRSMLPMLLLGLPALLFPSSTLALGFFVAAVVVRSAMDLPAAANHTVLNLMVAFALGAAALLVLSARNRLDSDRPFGERWLVAARTPIGLTVLVVYLFTAFHKLNTPFFDPVDSCAGDMLSALAAFNGLDGVAPGPAVVQMAAVGTVMVELALVGLLAVPRLRRWGLALGVGFHSILAFASFYDFATVVFAIYLLIVPSGAFAALAPRFDALRRVALVGFAVHVAISVWVGPAGSSSRVEGVPLHTMLVVTWAIAVLPLMAFVVWAGLRNSAGFGHWPGWSLRPVVLLVTPAMALVNGAAPYLGLKTVASYSMFSNVHTEPGHVNHLAPGVTALRVFEYERELVTLTKVELPDVEIKAAEGRGIEGARLRGRWARWILEEPPVTIPWIELRRVVQLWEEAGLSGVRVEYVRDGVPQVMQDAITDPELAAPMPWWQRHLLAFRAVDSAEGTDICRW